jgi:hypothetical protein
LEHPFQSLLAIFELGFKKTGNFFLIFYPQKITILWLEYRA